MISRRLHRCSRAIFAAGLALVATSSAAEALAQAPSPPAPSEPAPAVGETPSAPVPAPPTTEPEAETSSPAAVLLAPPAGVPGADAAPRSRRSVRATWVDPWGGSQLFAQVAVNPGAFAPALQQTRNTTVELAAFLSPRFSLGKDFQLRSSLPVSYEITDTSATGTTRQNELRLGNLTLGLWYRAIPEVWKTKILVAPTVALPTSPEARAQSMLFSPGLVVQASRPFEHVLGGDLLAIASVGYQRPFYEYTTPGVTSAPAYAPQCYGADPSCVEQVSGVANARDLFTWTVTLTEQWGPVSPGMLFRMTHVWPFTFSDLPGVERDPTRTSLRNQSLFSVWVDYSWNTWLTTELGYQLVRLSLDANGSYGNPVFSQYQDGMRFYLGTNISFDALMKSLRGEDAEGGVVRARGGGPLVKF